MTYENLLKWKKFFEERKDEKNLAKVLRNLKTYPQYQQEQKEKK